MINNLIVKIKHSSRRQKCKNRHSKFQKAMRKRDQKKTPVFSLQIICSEKACNYMAHCNYRGKDMKVGETFEIQEGCNTCTCLPSRTVSCTENPLPCRCQYKGRSYGIGDSFEEQCNTCTCLNDGTVRCTQQPCACVYEGRRIEVGSTFTKGDFFFSLKNDVFS